MPPERCVQVPLPLTQRARVRAPDDARRALGIESHHKVLLTVGWQYKYTPYSGDDLIAALGPILHEADVHLVAVGPRSDTERWSAARARFGGRVHAVGPQQDIQPYLDAADVFLDSYPIASLTAALEAATSGLPVVGLSPRDMRWPPILREDDPALVGAVFDDPDEYRDRITALLRDESVWRESSRSLQELCARSHGPDAWGPAMHRVHQALAGALQEGQRSASLAPLGSAGLEDDILATYIADCEDRLIRPELRLQFGDAVSGFREDGELESHVRRVDELLLQPSTPSAAQYEEALQCARDMSACVQRAQPCRV